MAGEGYMEGNIHRHDGSEGRVQERARQEKEVRGLSFGRIREI